MSPSIRLAAALLLALPAAARAGEGWEVRYRLVDGGHAEAATVRVEGERLGMRPERGAQEFLLGPEGILVIDHGDRTWGAMSFVELEAALEGVRRMFESMSAASREAIEEARRNMSPEEAARLDATPRGAGAVAFRETGETAAIAGLPARKSLVIEDGRPAGAMWTTATIPFGAVEGSLRRLFAAVPAELLGDAGVAARVPGLPGFPLLVEEPDGGGRAEAVAVERRVFDTAAWAAPAGYARTAIPGLGDLGGRR